MTPLLSKVLSFLNKPHLRSLFSALLHGNRNYREAEMLGLPQVTDETCKATLRDKVNQAHQGLLHLNLGATRGAPPVSASRRLVVNRDPAQ